MHIFGRAPTGKTLTFRVQYFLAAVVALTLVASALPVNPANADWSAFKLTHRRVFTTNAQEAAAEKVFRANVQFISEENGKNHSYTLGVNRFADLTTEQFEARYFTRQPSRSHNASSLHQWDAEQVLPAEVDWVAAGATNPIQDENLNGCFGACYAFAAAGAIEAAHQIQSGKLVAISEQQLVDCSSGNGNHGCQGGLMNYAYNYAINTDLCTRDSYPYNGPTKWGGCEQCKEIALAKGSVKDIKAVAADEQSLMSAVAQQPVSVGLEGAWADTNAFRFYKSGVLSTDCGQKVDHGVLVVGYGTDPTEGDYWKIRNSYGTNWGMEGYALLARGKGGAGECGLLASSMSYPVL